MAVRRLTLSVELLDGTEFLNVATTLADQMYYARQRRIYKWDPAQEDPVTYAAAMAYAALRRTSAFAGTWEEFVAQCAAVDVLEDDAVDPTRTAPSNA